MAATNRANPSPPTWGRNWGNRHRLIILSPAAVAKKPTRSRNLPDNTGNVKALQTAYPFKESTIGDPSGFHA
ncbi:hypothetical protein, partial [Neisseria gonorrhoeae]|uniref:hypothetical protein n=1 Tax=Neisseria gonorrhoeae TaxID=485 RepID=UPI001E55ED4B